MRLRQACRQRERERGGGGGVDVFEDVLTYDVLLLPRTF